MTQNEMMLLSRGRVPSHVVTMAMEEYRRNSDRSLNLDIEVIADKAHMSYDTLWTWVTKPEHGLSIEFDAADRVLCALGLWTWWYSRFSEYYEAVNLNVQQCACDGCLTTFETRTDTLGRPVFQLYCSPQCRHAAFKLREGRNQQRLAKSQRGNVGRPVGSQSLVCRNNHVRTPKNTKRRKDGRTECMICSREAGKRHYRAKQEAA